MATEDIRLEIDPDYCQGNCEDYVPQSPPEELKAKVVKHKSVKVTRGNSND